MADKIIVYSTDWCGDCRRAKRFLEEHGVAYENVNIEQTPGAVEIVKKYNNGNRSGPTIVFPDGSILVEPSNAQLAEKLGIGLEAER
jgi:mycoredoxin